MCNYDETGLPFASAKRKWSLASARIIGVLDFLSCSSSPQSFRAQKKTFALRPVLREEKIKQILRYELCLDLLVSILVKFLVIHLLDQWKQHLDCLVS